ncbi:MAG: hypothetical protein OEW62_06445 [Candidatus Bathyarchaeota archaeon]|nr:hypothetical protein [Candidatus Bathyarchaeota archaeon]MDH5734406.1 hypothetical protein [Candidatus Bathyarchaeota archaeon]
MHVNEFLGHRTVNSTLIHTHLINFEAHEYVTKISKSVEWCRRLIEAGFRYVTEHNDVKIFKKPR